MNGEFKDYYKILGVSRFATDAEIKKAYRKIAKNCHPDAIMEMNLSEKEKEERIELFKAASEAWEILGTADERAKYNVIYTEYYRKQAEDRMNAHRNQQSERTYSYDTEEDSYEDKEERQQSRRSNSKNATSQEKRQKRAKASEKKESFGKSIRQAYKEVKDDEYKNHFMKRHKIINRRYRKEFTPKNPTGPEVVLFRCGQGAIHVFFESWYQLKKLGHVTEDSVVKYLLRNRSLVAAVTLAIVMGNVMNNAADEPIKADGPSVITEQSSDYDADVNDDAVVAYTTTTVLNRNYKVGWGDMLSQLACDSGTSVRTIKEINDLSSDCINVGIILKIPYKISNEDLQYYTLSIPTEGRSIYDIANEFETDADTIYRLNKESIQVVEGAYIILSDRVLVPNFITQKELQDKKENQYTKTNE